MDFSKLNKEQKEAVEYLNGPLLILAGAGTGKTHTITYRVMNIIENGTDPSRILMLTFTNKAAKEMKERIVKLMDNEDGYKITGGTFHSFCANILRRNHDEIGLTSNFTICDQPDAAEIINLIKERLDYTKEDELPTGKGIIEIFGYCVNKGRTIEEAVENKYIKYIDKVEELEKIQEKYILYKYDNNLLDYDDLLVRTNEILSENDELCRKISNYYKYIIVDEYQDTNELQEQILLKLRQFENKNICVVGDDFQCLPKGTKIITKSGEKNIEEINADDFVLVANGHGNTIFEKVEEIHKKYYNKNLIKITTKNGFSLLGTPEHVIFAETNKNKNNFLLRMFGSNDFESSKNYIGYKHELKYNSNVEKFNEHLLNNIDKLNDIIYEIQQSTPKVNFERTAILTNENIDFSFIELQNISIGMSIAINLDNKIVKDEVINIEECSYDDYVYDLNIGKYRNYIANNICVHNCIYSFRGSRHDNILEFPNKFENCKVIKLIQNYRSSQEILDLANAISISNDAFKIDLVGQWNGGPKPHIIKLNTVNDQTMHIFKKINELLDNGEKPSEIAVLARTANDTTMLETKLAKIKYNKYGGIKFWERDATKNVLSFLKVLNNSNDEISWFRILKLYPALGAINAKKITEGILKNGIDELIDKKYEKKQFFGYLDELYWEYDKLLKMDLNDKLTEIIEEYYPFIQKRLLSNSKKKDAEKIKLKYKLEEDIDRLKCLYESAREHRTLNGFLNDIVLDTAIENSNENAITLSTIHSAKGLEWKYVFVMDCIQGKFPYESEIPTYTELAIKEHKEETEEERRVFYVAITRCKKELFLYYPLYNFRTHEENDLSQYLTENGNDRTLCEKIYVDY